MLAMLPLNVEIGLINVIANKQIISSDFKDIKTYMTANLTTDPTPATPPSASVITDADVKSVIDSSNNYPSFVTKTRNATQRDASKLFD